MLIDNDSDDITVTPMGGFCMSGLSPLGMDLGLSVKVTSPYIELNCPAIHITGSIIDQKNDANK